MRKRILACLLVLALLCTACGQSDCRRGEEKSRYDLCFLSTESGELTWESTLLPEGWGEVDGLLTLLLAGPQTLGHSPGHGPAGLEAGGRPCDGGSF